MHRSAYRTKRKGGNPPAWAWPWSVALLAALAAWAAWFITSGAIRP